MQPKKKRNLVFDLQCINDDVLTDIAGNCVITIIDITDRQMKETMLLDSGAYSITGKDYEHVFKEIITIINLQNKSLQEIVKVPKSVSVPHIPQNIMTCYNAVLHYFVDIS